jgi:hypothetical protein
VAMGENHTIFLNKFGDPYSFGTNFHGQLGVGDDYINSPFPLSINSENKISNIFSSRYFSFSTTELYKCNKKEQYNIEVCSGNGNCIYNECECHFGFFGKNCEFTSCFEVKSDNSTVCSGNGKCISLNKCECNNGYRYNENCSNYTCFSIHHDNKNVCSNNGKCVSLDNCKCNIDFFHEEGNFIQIMKGDCRPKLTIIVSLIIIIFLFLILTIVLIFSGVIVIFLLKKQKKFMNKNKELTEKLLLISDLEKINFKKLKFKKNNGSFEIIGKGSSSIVYLGYYNNKNVAIKEVNLKMYQDTLLTEIIILKNLKFKNIIKYWGFSVDNIGNFYIITEYCSNGSLDNYIINNKLTIQEKYNIILNISDGIHYIHSKSTPIIHRGIFEN